MANFPILRLSGVTRYFNHPDAPAVCNVSVTLEQGDILALLGPSGCGKTTLLRLIAGFDQPQHGQIAIAEQTVTGQGVALPPEKRSVGMVFQDFALFPHLSVADNVAFGLRHLDRHTAQERVNEAIALVGLPGMEQRYPHELSGGQQQRVALARALAPRPNLVLLDEPLSNLDVQVRLYLRQEVRDILKATGTSAIFVTHDQEEAMAIADRVAVMRHGQIEQFDTPERIYQAPTSRFVAEFVTQANFLPATATESGWETEMGRFDVLNGPPEGTPGELMIRQEDLELELSAEGNAVVRDRQFLGREYRYCLVTPSGRSLYARTSTRTQLPIGATVALKVAIAHLQWFPLTPLTHPRSLSAALR